MKTILSIMAFILITNPVTIFAGGYGNDRYELKTNPYGQSYGGSTEIELKKRYDYNPATKYRGEIEDDGYVRIKNYKGERLRGYIDEDGYGKLRDQDGNVYKVRPR